MQNQKQALEKSTEEPKGEPRTLMRKGRGDETITTSTLFTNLSPTTSTPVFTAHSFET
jgi:hypothetical protein